LEETSQDVWQDAQQTHMHSHRISFIEDGLVGTVWYDAVEEQIVEPTLDIFFTPDMFPAPTTEDNPIWYDCREEGDPIKWHDCQEPKDLRTQRISQRILKKSQAKHAQGHPPVVIGFPQVMMILSCVMLTMYSVGMLLKHLGFKWRDGWRLYFPIFTPLLNSWTALKLYWWPPPSYARTKSQTTQQVNNKSANRQKLLLTALAIAAMKCDSLPHITLSPDRALRQRIRSASRRGLLNTARLRPEDQSLLRAAIQAMPAHLYAENDSVLWVIDTGCTDTSTGFRDDFKAGTLKEMKVPRPMAGAGGMTFATHEGTVAFEVLADNGTVHPLETTSYFVPGLDCRLLSPQTYFIEQKKRNNTKCKLEMDHTGTAFAFDKDTRATMPHDPYINLPRLRAYHDTMKTAESLAYACVSDERNQNLSHRAKALLRWHFKLGHIGFQRLQWIGRQGWIGKAGEYFGLSTVQIPKCAACQFGKQERLKTAGQTTTVDTAREGVLKQDKLEPGDQIFADQYESSLPGRVFGRRGAAIHSKTYRGGTLFCDAASTRIFLQHQMTLAAQETIETKLTFERDASQAGVQVKSYRTDNGIFTSKEFLDSLVQDKQVISHSGVGGHHHNGVAENAIKHTTFKARTMMIHQALRWPEAADKTLWPLALEHAVYLHNHTPQEALGGLTPEEIWSKSIASHSSLLHAHVWGCPAYVLDPRLTDGRKIPKWQPRSRRGMYVGRSRLHASSVGLILNLHTSNISPQFHVVYNDFFETVHSDEADEPACWGES
jgi:hypothetical protein